MSAGPPVCFVVFFRQLVALPRVDRDYAVQAQFGQDLVIKEEISRILNMLPGDTENHLLSFDTNPRQS